MEYAISILDKEYQSGKYLLQAHERREFVVPHPEQIQHQLQQLENAIKVLRYFIAQQAK